jgi:hypothetical protein
MILCVAEPTLALARTGVSEVPGRFRNDRSHLPSTCQVTHQIARVKAQRNDGKIRPRLHPAGPSIRQLWRKTERSVQFTGAVLSNKSETSASGARQDDYADAIPLSGSPAFVTTTCAFPGAAVR